MSDFWNKYVIPIQYDYEDVEQINPAEAYRRQAEAINLAGPLYAELEVVKRKQFKITKLHKELKDRILAQNMPVPSSSTRTNDLVDGFILNGAKTFTMSTGEVRDVSDYLLRLQRRLSDVTYKIVKIETRLKALESMAEKCQKIMDWKKFEYKVDTGR